MAENAYILNMKDENGNWIGIPVVRGQGVPPIPSQDGTYRIKLVVSDGVSTISWEKES